MRGKYIKQVRAKDCVERMPRGTFWTFTTADVVDLLEIRSRWRGLRHEIQRYLGRSEYIMNYELHPGGHGWHIHAVFSRFYSFDDMKKYSSRFGFGRIDCRAVWSNDISEYLTKHCMKSYKSRLTLREDLRRVRLVNVSRGLPSLSSYEWFSDSDYSSHCIDWKNFLLHNGFEVRKIGIDRFNYLCLVGSVVSYQSERPFTEIVKEIF